ncbi:MAG TPA: hypothetical protein VN181_07600, partial [Thermoanaerobaculia bacterium]|nr:hypothetical protein [Thermoanaerobaculia bacterium]
LAATTLAATTLAAADQPLARLGYSLGSETPAGAPLVGGQAVAQEMGDTVAIGDDTLVVWSEYRQAPVSIFAAAVASDGSRRHPNGVMVAAHAGDHASVATNGKLIVITWSDPFTSTFSIARVRPDLTLIDTRSYSGSAWPTVASNGKTFLVAHGASGQRVEAMLLDDRGEVVKTVKIGSGLVPKVASNGDEYAIASYYSGGGGNVVVLDANVNVLTARQLDAWDVPNITACGRRFFVTSPTATRSVDLVIVEGSSLIAAKPVDVGRYAEQTALASSGNDVLLTLTGRGTHDLIGIRLDADGTPLGGTFPIAGDLSTYAIHSVTWNGSAYVAAWEWSDNVPVNPKIAIRYALVRGEVMPPPVVSGAQLTTPPGSMADAQGAIDDNARFAVWSEANGRTRYRLGNRDADLGDNAIVRGTAVGNRFAIVWSSGGLTSITLAGIDGTREDIALPFGEITRASVAWDGSRFLIAAAGPGGVSFARVSAAGVLFDLTPRVLDARAASAVAVTSM